MKQVYNIMRAREYESGKGTKTAWDRVGLLLIDGDKISLRLDAIPAGSWDGWLKAFPREDERSKGSGGMPSPRGGGASNDLDDDIAF